MKRAILVVASAFLVSAVAVPAFAVSSEVSVICRFLSGSCPIEKGSHQKMAREKAEQSGMTSKSSYTEDQGVNQHQQDVRDRFLSNHTRPADQPVYQPVGQE